MLMLDSSDKRRASPIEGGNPPVMAEPWREGIGFKIFLEKVRHQTLMILRLAMVGAGIGLFTGLSVSLIKIPTFSASSELLVSNTTLQLSGPDAVVTQVLVENSLIQSSIEMLKSSKVLDRVIDALGFETIVRISPRFYGFRVPWSISASDRTDADKRQIALATLRSNTRVNRIGASQIISVRAKALTADDAARLTNEIAKAFVQEQNETNAVIATSAALRERIKVLGPTARIISEAFPPTSKDIPITVIMLLPVLLAGGLGAAIGLAITLFDRRVRCAGQLAAKTPGEFFGYLPRATRPQSISSAPDQTIESAPVNAVLRRARAAVIERSGKVPRFVGVTSCQETEQKSTLAAEWARSIARDGCSVLLVDASHDPARGVTSESPQEARGLHELLRGEVAALSDVVQVEKAPNLDFLPNGKSSGNLDMLWCDLAYAVDGGRDCKYDWIVLDLPSLANADVRACGQMVDHVLVVLEWGQTTEAQLEQAMRALGPVRRNIVGTIIGDTPRQSVLVEILTWMQAARRVLLSMNGTVVRSQAARRISAAAAPKKSIQRDGHGR